LSSLDTYKYPSEVKWKIDQNSKKDYLNLAKEINDDISISGVILQHEYGIFGGSEGENILWFMENCKKPIIVTLHTALPSPSPKMREVTRRIIELGKNVIVLTKGSKEIFERVYPGSVGKISVIPHGIHPVAFSDQKEFKAKLELSNNIVLSTFGLLSRGKGIEYVIQAMPEVIKKYPSAIYLILGETHPVVRRAEGEKYRLELVNLVTKLGMKKYVKFYDQHLDLPDLLEFLQATDIYISTSTNPNQAVSGTLSYALGSGRAVISTDFAQAREIITPKVGKLVPIKNPKAFTLAILDLLKDKEKLNEMARSAFDKTRPMLWSNVAKKYTELLARTIIPPMKLDHLYKMTDDTGLFQFAKFSVPNRDFGYTLDDNARAIVLCSRLIKEKSSKKLQELVKIYFAFIKMCQKENGSFVNYIGYPDKEPTIQNKKEDLEDTTSRAMWALSEIMGNTKLPVTLRNEAKRIFLLSLEKRSKLNHPRSKALAIKAFATMLPYMPEHQKTLLRHIKEYAESLADALKENSYKSWIWFEKDLYYNNAILSEGLFIAGDLLKDSLYKIKAVQSLQFLISKTFSQDMYMPIGHSNWYRHNSKRSQYDQQPEDAASMILALSSAYKSTCNEEYKNLAKKCFGWYLGNNSINKPVYDKMTGGCYDGLHPDRVNLNQGGESLISYLMSSYTITELH